MDKENMKGRFWVFWMRKTIRKVTMIVPVLITVARYH
jgi:hypothetical protein